MKNLMMVAMIVTVTFCSLALADEQCDSTVITSSATVNVSDGMQYGVDTYYRNLKETVVSFVGPDASDIVSEGPYAWYRQGEKVELATDREKRFAIGHQYHAMLLQFDGFMTDVRDDEVVFQGGNQAAQTGNYPHGGTVSLIKSTQTGRPTGFLMMLPDEGPIEVILDDWRENESGQHLPFGLQIHHGERIFSYEYQEVIIGEGDALYFHERYPSPGIDEITEYRNQQSTLARQCSKDIRDLEEFSG